MKKLIILVGILLSGITHADAPFKYLVEGDEPQYSGKVVLQSPKGWRYVGSVKNGKPNGNGMKITGSGVILYGQWSDGELVGEGAIVNPPPFNSVKAGNVDRDKITGEGVLIMDNEVYEGSFGKYGAPHGEGVCTTGKERKACEFKHGAKVE